MNRKTVAFDWGGTLNRFPILRELFHNCPEAHVISAYPVTNTPEQVKQSRSNYAKEMKIDQSRVHMTPHPAKGTMPDSEVGYKAGVEKAKKMKEVGAVILIDDNHYVCHAVRDAGLFAMHICGSKELATK